MVIGVRSERISGRYVVLHVARSFREREEERTSVMHSSIRSSNPDWQPPKSHDPTEEGDPPGRLPAGNRLEFIATNVEEGLLAAPHSAIKFIDDAKIH